MSWIPAMQNKIIPRIEKNVKNSPNYKINLIISPKLKSDSSLNGYS